MIAALLLAGLLAVGPGQPQAPAGGEGTSSTTPTSSTVPSTVPAEAPAIIPLPDSGRPPQEPGDRGGSLQYAVLALVVAGLGTIAVLAVRDARRAR